MAEESGLLVVRRSDHAYRDGLRRYRIEVDGEAVGKVRPGEQLRISVPPGPHRVQARIDGSGSPEVHVQVPPDGEIHMLVEPGGPALAAVLQIAGRTSWLQLSEQASAAGSAETVAKEKALPSVSEDGLDGPFKSA